MRKDWLLMRNRPSYRIHSSAGIRRYQRQHFKLQQLSSPPVRMPLHTTKYQVWGIYISKPDFDSILGCW
jgi:hypothetical protein